jgi:hypothetical protein
MSARRRKATKSPKDFLVLASAEFEPIEECKTWNGTDHAKWAEASKSLRQGVIFARATCAMDRMGVLKTVADIMATSDGLKHLEELLAVWEGNITQCKALAEMLEIARARTLVGMAAFVDKVPA